MSNDTAQRRRNPASAANGAKGGRPLTNQPPKTRHTVTLDKATLDALLAISENLSESIRVLVARQSER